MFSRRLTPEPNSETRWRLLLLTWGKGKSGAGLLRPVTCQLWGGGRCQNCLDAPGCVCVSSSPGQHPAPGPAASSLIWSRFPENISIAPAGRSSPGKPATLCHSLCPGLTPATEHLLSNSPRSTSAALAGLLKWTLVHSQLIHRHPELMLINQQLVINMRPNCSSPQHAHHAHHASAPGTFLRLLQTLGALRSLCPRGSLQTRECAHRHFYPLHVCKAGCWRGSQPHGGARLLLWNERFI